MMDMNKTMMADAVVAVNKRFSVYD